MTLHVETGLADGVGVVSFTTSDAGNRLSPEDVSELAQALDALPASWDAVVLRGGGTDFCSGRVPGSGPALDTPAVVDRVLRLARAYRDVPMPTVSWISGAAIGAGGTLALQADVVVAASDAYLQFPEVEHGFFPVIAFETLCRRVRPPVALRLILTGERLAAPAAHELGLIDDVGDEASAVQWARAIAPGKPVLPRGRRFADTVETLRDPQTLREAMIEERDNLGR